MADRVVVQKWKTFDGREHDTEAAAKSWETHLYSQDRASRVVEVLETKVRNNHFYALTKDKALFPYCYDDGDQYDQNQFLEDLGKLIVDHWDDLKRALEGDVIPAQPQRSAETVEANFNNERRSADARMRAAIDCIAKFATSAEMRAAVESESAQSAGATQWHATAELADFRSHYDECVAIAREVKESSK